MKPSDVILSSFVSVAFATTASAVTVVSNAATTNSSSTYLESTFATSFTTGSGPGWTLDSVELLLGREPGSVQEQSVNVVLLSDGGGVPGVAITALTRPALGTFPEAPTLQLFSFDPSTSVTLAANTTYWISAEAASAPDGNRISWGYTGDDSDTGLAGWSVGDTRYQLDGSWSEYLPGTPAAQQFSVNATAVPEPTGALLAGLGTLGLILRRRRG